MAGGLLLAIAPPAIPRTLMRGCKHDKHRPEVAKAFVIMPFAAELDHMYDVIKRAVATVDEGSAISPIG